MQYNLVLVDTDYCKEVDPMRNMYCQLVFSLIPILLLGCGGGNNSYFIGDAAGNEPFNYQCVDTPSYEPIAEPILHSTDNSNGVVIIALHGKGSTPNAPHLSTFYDDATELGYDIVAPYMPWSYLWDGTLCQGIEYISSLIDEQQSNGKEVILVGHSMGGSQSLNYQVTSGVILPTAVMPVAPGHMIHLSNRTRDLTTQSIAEAESLVEQGLGDQPGDFIMLNNGKPFTVLTTPVTYLSYSDFDSYPDIEQVLPSNSTATLWIAGQSDRITDIFNMSELFAEIPSNGINEYHELVGDHHTVLENAADELDKWLHDWFFPPVP